MREKLIGIVAIVVLVAFLGILVGFVPTLDLLIVVVVVSARAAYDFYLLLFKDSDGTRS